MTDDQRTFLLRKFETSVELCEEDKRKAGTLSDENRRYIEQGTLALEWLRGERPPMPALLAYLEERLEAIDSDFDYETALEVVTEHDTFAAAIAELR
jgi:hypothetical protein